MKYLYLLTFSNGKKYIGQTKDPERRRYDHQYEAFKALGTRVVLRAIRKHGPPLFHILAVVEDSDINDLEVRAIQIYDTLAPHGYNVAEGGAGPTGYQHSAEARQKISDANRKRWESSNYRSQISSSLALVEDERAAKISKTLKEQRSTAEYRTLMSERAQTFCHNPDYREAQAERARRQWTDPEKRRRLLEARKKPKITV